MRQRALVHVAGPPAAGKTTFIERLLGARLSLAICVRFVRDPSLKTERESAPRAHPELRRYRAADSCAAAALYRFPELDVASFFMSDVMQEYSEAVYIEGDCPLEYVDIRVFVAPSLPPGEPLLRRVKRRDRPLLDFYERLAAPGLGDLPRPLLAQLARLRQAPPSRPRLRWSLAPGYEGIESAQLVVVNARDDAERGRAERFVQEVARLRKDAAVFSDLVGLLGHRIPITAVAANLSDPRDAGLKKAIARIRRALQAGTAQ
jgi:hypothetical protein